MINNPYYKVTVMLGEDDEEVHNRVLDAGKFTRPYAEEGIAYMVEKLSDEEFDETEK